MKIRAIFLIFTLLISAGFLNSVSAGNLCEDQCQLTITFPDGGSIEAVESFSITFGEGGFINYGAVVTGYASGQILNIDQGQSLQFDAGGELDLGTAGNIEYSDLSVSSTGIFSVVALGGAERINIYSLTLSDVTLDLSSNSDLVIQTGGALNLNQPHNLVTVGTGSGTVTLTSGSGGVSMSTGTIETGSGTVVDPGSVTLTTGGAEVSISSGSVVDGVLQESIFLTLTSGSNGDVSINAIDAQSPIVIQSPITIADNVLLDDLSLLQGLTINMQDGASCQVVNDQCVTDSGTIYVLKDGALKISDDNTSDGSSGFDPLLILFSSLLFIGRLRFKFQYQ